MVKVIALALLAAALVVASAGWALVTTDRWPLSDRAQPATAVYAANRAAARWLLEHGEQFTAATAAAEAAAALPAPAPEPITEEEIQRAMKEDPRLRNRIVLNAGGAALIPKPRG